jgi:hypothetical protein
VLAIGGKAKLPGQFWAIKSAASQAKIDAAGTVTHHEPLGAIAALDTTSKCRRSCCRLSKAPSGGSNRAPS